jgi:hypothetical protein
MRPRIRYINFFEAESVCTGDLLKNKEDKRIFVVLGVNAEGEEWYCIQVQQSHNLNGHIELIGFEHLEDYSKGIIEQVNYE